MNNILRLKFRPIIILLERGARAQIFNAQIYFQIYCICCNSTTYELCIELKLLSWFQETGFKKKMIRLIRIVDLYFACRCLLQKFVYFKFHSAFQFRLTQKLGHI